MKIIPAILAICIFLTIIPIANAGPTAPTPTQIQDEIYNQVDISTAGGNSCSSIPTTLSLNQGSHIFIFGGNQLAGNAGTNLLFGATSVYRVRTDGIIDQKDLAGTTVTLLRHTNQTTAFAAAVRVDNLPAGTYSIDCLDGGSNGYQTIWQFAPGLTESTLIALEGRFTISGVNTAGFAFAIPTASSETAILNTQTEKLPVQSKFTWIRINNPNNLFDSSTDSSTNNLRLVGSGATISFETRQSISPDSTKGKYLTNTRFSFILGDCSRTTPAFITVGTSNSAPWDTTKELFNFTGNFVFTSQGQSTQSHTFDIDFENGTITSSGPSIASWSATSTKGVSPFYNQTLYLRISTVGNVACSGGTGFVEFKRGTGVGYDGGTEYDCSALTSCTQNAALDWTRLTINAYAPQTGLQFKLNTSFRNVGGASYVYILEQNKDTNPQQALVSSNFGGSAVSGGTLFVYAAGSISQNCYQRFFFLNPSCNPTPTEEVNTADCQAAANIAQSCVIQEMRLGYVDIPLITSQTLTINLDTNVSGRNRFFVGILTNQPVQTHIGKVTFDNQAGLSNNLETYTMLSTDDYYAQLIITTKECFGSLSGTGICTGTTANLPNVTTITYLTGRTITNLTNDSAQAVIIGQDLAQRQFAITLQKVGYFTQTYAVTLGYGQSNLTLYIRKLVDTEGSLTTEFISCTPETQTVQVPNQANFSIQNTYEGTVFYSFYRIQTNGLPSFIGSIYEFTGLTGTILYPPGRSSNNITGQNDTGAYILAFSNEKGEPIQTCAFAINSGNTNFQIPIVDQTALSTIQATLQTPIAQAIISQRQASEEAQTSNAILQAAIWWFSDGPWTFGVPHFVVVLIWISIIALMLYFAMRTRERM